LAPFKNDIWSKNSSYFALKNQISKKPEKVKKLKSLVQNDQKLDFQGKV